MNREIITSASNSKIKRLVNLLKKGRDRRSEGVFVCEGRKMFLEVLGQFPERIKEAYLTPAVYEELIGDYSTELNKINCQLVDEEVFRKMAETVTPQGAMAIVDFPSYELEQLGDETGIRLLFLDDLRDPGNLGTIIRTAEAAGMSGIVLSDSSVDVTNPKVVRSTMGAMLRVPVVYTSSIVETLEKFRKIYPDFKAYATSLDCSKPYNEVFYGTSYGLIIGNESVGVSEAVVKAADASIHIPMEGQVESLNAAVAAAIVMYEAKNHRDK